MSTPRLLVVCTKDEVEWEDRKRINIEYLFGWINSFVAEYYYSKDQCNQILIDKVYNSQLVFLLRQYRKYGILWMMLYRLANHQDSV